MVVGQDQFRGAVLEIAHRKGVSIRQLATRMHINHSQVSRPLNGKTAFKREWLIRLCKALECSSEEAAEIFSHTDYRAPSEEELEDTEESHAPAA